MQIDKAPFPVHTIDLNNAKVLTRPDQAEGAKGKNVVIGEERPKNANGNVLDREVILEKTPDGKESIKITIKARVPGGQEGVVSSASRPVVQDRPVRPVDTRADQQPSSLNARKWVLGRPMSQRCRGELQIRNPCLASF